MSLIPGFLETVKFGDIFIETGTGGGGGVWEASAAGFRDIITIDHAEVDFPEPPGNVYRLTGHSPAMLGEVLGWTTAAFTLFLDAHESGKSSPLSDELDAVDKFAKFPHRILIDDLRRYYDRTWNPPVAAIIKRLLLNYDIAFAPNRVQWDDILIATRR